MFTLLGGERKKKWDIIPKNDKVPNERSFIEFLMDKHHSVHPITFGQEIELNNKQNRQGLFSGNGVWQLSLDYMPNDKIRLSSNFLVDELVLDKVQKNEGKTNGLAGSFSIIWTNESKNINIFCLSKLVLFLLIDLFKM